jgi:hypothetical protein
MRGAISTRLSCRRALNTFRSKVDEQEVVGDSFTAVFHSASDAFNAALPAQQSSEILVHPVQLENHVELYVYTQH